MECPGCFWSTTVKKEEDLKSEAPAPSAHAASPSSESKPSLSLNFLKPLLVVLILSLLFAGVVSVVWFRVRGSGIHFSLPGERISTKGQPNSAQEGSLGSVEALSVEEKNILSRIFLLSTNRPLSEEERKILESRAPFQTGIVEKLPSKVWMLENFKQMIAEQERFYKIPLPRSYKNKLYDLFLQKYVSAQGAFESGELTKARDLWVESLAFPIYGDDVQKHRGVVLTMIRPYINDTLSKIGTINSSVVERHIREREQVLSQSYGEFFDLLQKKSWVEAWALVPALEQKIDELENPLGVKLNPPPYPPAIKQIDQDIQMTLQGIAETPPPALADLSPLREDIQAKKRVLQSFLPELLSEVLSAYDKALEKIRLKEWREAERLLGGIEFPLELVHDAKEKIKVLNQLRAGEGQGET